MSDEKKQQDLALASSRFKWVVVISSISLLINWAVLTGMMPEQIRVVFYFLAVSASVMFVLHDVRGVRIYQELQRETKTSEPGIAMQSILIGLFFFAPVVLAIENDLSVWLSLFLSLIAIVIQLLLIVLAVSFFRNKAAAS